MDISSNYTVEITAAGMTQSEQISITSDPIKVSGFQIDTSKKTEMKVSWEYTGNDPEDGWLLLYTVDGSGPQTIPCEKASAVISPLIPGAYYKFVLQAADDRTIFNNTERYQAADAEHFTEHNVKLETFSFDLIKTPTEADWSFETVQPEDYTDTFAVGESVSVVMQSTNTFYLPGNKTNILFVFRDSFGNVLPDQIQELSCNWKSIWTKGDTRTGELNIPSLPTTPGAYVMELYFNGSLVTQFDITIAG